MNRPKNSLNVGLALFVTFLFAAPAQAVLDIDITFSPGAEPADFGFGGSGGDNPANNGSLDPIAGVWNAGSPTSSAWARMGNGIQSLLSPGVTLIHGFAEVDTINPSGNIKNMIVAGIGLPDVDFAFGFTGTTLAWAPDDGGAAPITVIGNVANSDGDFHKIGWEADLNAQTLTAFFDDVQVGVPQDVSGGGAFGNDTMFFGSGFSGSQSNTWTRVVFGEGRLLTGGPQDPDPTDFTWKTDTSGDWNDTTHWSPSGGPPGIPTMPQYLNHSVEFGDVIMSTQTVFSNTEVFARQITFNSEHGYAIAGRGSVSLVQGTSARLPATNIQVANGNHEFQLRVSLEANTEVNVANGQSLEFNNRLFLNNNILTKTGEGTMAINNSVLTGGGTINCEQGTCSGTGTVGGDLNNSGGTISPGNSGSLSVVPEPSSLSLMVLTTLALGAFRPRSRRKWRSDR